jgi:hypothetical protein
MECFGSLGHENGKNNKFDKCLGVIILPLAKFVSNQNKYIQTRPKNNY